MSEKGCLSAVKPEWPAGRVPERLRKRSVKQESIQRFYDCLGEENVLTDEPMSSHTTFRIGGLADIFLIPHCMEEIQKILMICGEEELPCFVLGNGSNLLVSDAGYRGVIIQLYHNLDHICVEGASIRAEAGAPLSVIAAAARDASLTGFEFAAGIPGTLGGAVVMNAGAYGGEMKDVLREATVLTESGELLTIPASGLALDYRTSLIKTAGYLVVEAVLDLQPGEEKTIRERMRELAAQRKSKQPLEFPSAGSTFKRPKGYFAGKLIMDSGLAGYRVGGAQVSEKHCGFVINTGGATASDVRRLIADVSDRVYSMYGVKLEPEIKFLGDFDVY